MATYTVGLSGRTYTNVNAAIAAAIAANDTAALITIAAGTYNTGVNAVMNPSQWASWRILPCTIQAEDAANKPVFDGTSLGNVTRAVNLTGAAPLEASSGRVTLKNLVWQNWADQTNGVIDLSGGSAVATTIDGCEFKTLTGSAIPILPGTAATAGNYSVVKNCWFYNVTKHSIRGTSGGVCNYATIYNNRFYGGNSAGYAVSSQPRRSVRKASRSPPVSVMCGSPGLDGRLAATLAARHAGASRASGRLQRHRGRKRGYKTPDALHPRPQAGRLRRRPVDRGDPDDGRRR